MNLRTTIIAAVLAFAALLAAPALAAQSGYITQNTTAYGSPQNGVKAIGSFAAGQKVTVITCANSWCQVSRPGLKGWVRQNRVGSVDNKGNPAPKIPFNFGFSIGGDGKPSISIGIGNQPKPPVEEDLVCFYKGENYSGAERCAEPGDFANLTGSWRDAIESIRVFGDAEVTVCRNYDLSGYCANIVSSRKVLQDSLYDRIRSYEVN